ncbi:ABC transporter substrate-binding protein [Cytobacillus massiliigabonensis]|uniref:ABC transporter substrate-binding protein n=1 Tax=Cytobacillus massiliigabonensis TaxID=1871011 RepID=UPI000C866740|nr:ABC transporter substrate-binding protein [Cytobacillus massiliigabonensis]
MRYFNKCSLLIIIFILILAGLTGCNQSKTINNDKDESEVNLEKTVKEEKEPATRMFTDSTGREVKLPTNITKVAPSGPLAQMVLYSIAPEKMIGWARKPSGDTEKYFNQKALNLPSFGMFYGDTFNLEALMAAKPDVILDIGEAKKTIKEDMDEIQKTTGIPTIFIEAKLDTIPEAYMTLGDILSEEDYGKKLADYSAEAIKSAQEFHTGKPENERIKIFYGIGKDGLNTNGKGSFHAEILDFVGLDNVAVLDQVASKGGGNEVSMEQLLLWQPDVIIFEPNSRYDDVLAGDAIWKDLEAVQEGRVYEVPVGPYNWLGFPPSVNRILGIKWLGNLFYPEQFNYDMLIETKEFYQLFFRYELTDKEATELLSRSTLK